MKQILWILLMAFCLRTGAQEAKEISKIAPVMSGNWVLVIHGGAGGPPPGEDKFVNEDDYAKSMNEALAIGRKVLSEGGSAMNAVEAVIRFMEDDPMFNAGKGAVLNEKGQVALDASIMDGLTLRAGAVADVSHIKNPIAAARMVMENTKHILLVGPGAENFAKTVKLEMVEPSYFVTRKQQERYDQKKKEVPKETPVVDPDKDHGTVGAVALDQMGNLAAATSTGGISGKMEGRVGDTPIIGAGTYANNNTCAVSCTGDGEFFMRTLAAFDVSSLMECRGMPLEEAGKTVIMEKLASLGGKGGLIAIDRDGNITMPFNTKAMIRGYARNTGESEILFYP